MFNLSLRRIAIFVVCINMPAFEIPGANFRCKHQVQLLERSLFSFRHAEFLIVLVIATYLSSVIIQRARCCVYAIVCSAEGYGHGSETFTWLKYLLPVVVH